jgi:uncharacterized membrane protein YdbT with pleckstrin-like domain
MSADFDQAGRVYSETILRQLEHEDGLMVNRLSWLVASQSFLFTAYAIVLNGTLTTRSAVPAERQAQLIHIVPELGLVTCALIYLGVVAGVYVTVALRRNLRKHLAKAISVSPPLPGTRTTHMLGLGAPLLLPPLFFAAWAVLLIG